MPSFKSKNYGAGPRGYFQRVLSDGARPFQYQPQTGRLLGSQRMSAVKPIGARQVSSLSFQYQHRLGGWDGLNPVSNSEQAIESSGVDEPKINPVVTENNITGSQQRANIETDNNTDSEFRTAAIRNTNDNMTLLSWLEKMQARQPLLTDEDSQDDAIQPRTAQAEEQANSDDQKTSTLAQAVAPTSTRELTARMHSSPTPLQENGANQLRVVKETGQKISTQPQSSASKQGIQTDTTRQSASIATLPDETPAPPTAVLPDPASALKNKDSTVSQKIKLPVAPAKGIDLPDGTRPNVSHLTSVVVPSLSSDQPGPAKPASLPMPGQKHQFKKDRQDKIPGPDPVGDEGRQAAILPKQQSLQSLPVTMPNSRLQGMNIEKLRKALSVSPKRFPSAVKSTSSTQSSESSVAPQTLPFRPRLQQQVTIVNPPARSNQRAAFWERSHMSRFGPRSYK